MKSIFFIVISSYLLLLAGCSGNDSSEVLKITDSLKRINAEYQSQLQKKDLQMKSVEEKTQKMALLQDTIRLLTQKLNILKSNQGSSDNNFQNATLIQKSKDDAKVIEELTKALSDKKKQADELSLQIKSSQSDKNLMENKAKEAELAKEKLENEIKDIQSKLSDVSAIQVSSVSVQFYRKGFGKSAGNIKMTEFCFLVNTNPLATDGKKIIHACIFDPGGNLINSKEEDVFTNPKGEKTKYTFNDEMDFKKSLTIEDKCINWNNGDLKLKSGSYNIKFYIETKFSGEATFVVP
jgi:hypothetical protein